MQGQGKHSIGDDRLKRLSDLGSSGLAMEVDAPVGGQSSMTANYSLPADSPNPPAAPAEALEQVLKFLTSPDDRQDHGEPRSAGGQTRDLRSALELANKLFEAVRAADERVIAADEFQKQLVDLHNQQVNGLEGRISTSDRRAKLAEARAKDAEAWLAKFHDNIVDDFKRTFAAR